MESLWNTSDAEAFVRQWASMGFSRDVGLRIYTSRLLGGVPSLVQHGGGNTSQKTTDHDLAGDTIEVIRVKGSGWDLANIAPAGLPAMRLDTLVQLKSIAHMSDETMVNALRSALLDNTSPSPSVETLLHAWIPHATIDHTHANAILALTDQADGEQRARDLYGEDMAICPYVMPGFGLAHAALRTFENQPTSRGMILLKHGIFTWGADPRESYELMIEMVSRAEQRTTRVSVSGSALPIADVRVARQLGPILRGALASQDANGQWKRMILDRRSTPDVMSYLANEALERCSQGGPATPDHVLRIKPWPLLLPDLTQVPTEAVADIVYKAVDDYKTRYQSYFDRNNARAGGGRKALDPLPRVILAPGIGLFGAGLSVGEATIAADVALTNADVISRAEFIGQFESIPEADIFDVEYWSLEQAKLGKTKLGRLAGHVVVVTGGAGAIGAATALAFSREGAHVAVLDKNIRAAQSVAETVKGVAATCDVTDPASVQSAMDFVIDNLGGIDIVVSNAGAAWSGRIGDVTDAILRQSFELNFFAHQSVAQTAVRIMLAQSTPSVLLFNISKQAVNPGADFGPYGLPKAALMALMRQYAIDYGASGIRSNGINADRIRSGLLTDEMVRERSKARLVSEADYMSGNLLRLEVSAEDVGQAFVSLALAERTTGAVLTVDGGNIAAAMR